jgi:hypothetical protein
MNHPCLCDICLKARDSELRRFEEAMDKLERENRCMWCGRKMHNVKDSITGKISPYLWKCDCFSKNIVFSKG